MRIVVDEAGRVFFESGFRGKFLICFSIQKDKAISLVELVRVLFKLKGDTNGKGLTQIDHY